MLNFVSLLASGLEKLGSEKWAENVLKSLGIMWKGVLAIFIVITLIILSVYILNSLTKKKKTDSDDEEAR